jgi:ABC-type cobalamin/Fe3+-siderophores transport system ATPase subunit
LLKGKNRYATGTAEEMITETALKEIYGIDVVVVSGEDGEGRQIRSVIPCGIEKNIVKTQNKPREGEEERL